MTSWLKQNDLFLSSISFSTYDSFVIGSASFYTLLSSRELFLEFAISSLRPHPTILPLGITTVLYM